MNKKNSKSKAPSFQFYSIDWTSSQTVRTLTFEEKGFYIDVLCLMHQNEKVGYLSKRSEEHIHNLIGCSSRLIPRLSATLVELGLLLKDEVTGELYNERMVRDAAISKARRESGKLGGNPNLVNQNVNQKPTPSSSSSSSSSSSTTINKKSILKKEETEVSPSSQKKVIKEFFESRGQQQALATQIAKEKNADWNLVLAEIQNFVDYWQEPSSKGKQRWEDQKFFELRRRLGTWFKNVGGRQVTKKEEVTFNL